VARQYGVTIQEIMEWNGKRDFSLSVGEKLKVAAR
jgi:membrane-bound lytic murein transglycosylase D